MLDARFLLRPGLALEEVSLADTSAGIGFAPEVARVTRTDGPRFTHDVDAGVLAILSGLNPDGLPLRDVVGLYAAANGLYDYDEIQQVETSAVPAVVDLIRHGLVLPAGIATTETTT